MDLIKLIFNLAVRLFVVLIVISCISCATRPERGESIPVVEIGKEFSPQELAEDLDYLIKSLEEIHPDLYAFTPKEIFYTEVERIRDKMNEPATRKDFYILAAPLVTMLQDGHTGAQVPREEWSSYLEEGGKFFPLEINIYDGKVTIIENPARGYPGVVTGSELLSVNGISIEEIVNNMLNYLSGERKSFREKRVEMLFKRLLWLLYGFSDSFELELFCSVNNVFTKVTVEGITNRDLKTVSSVQQEPYSFQVIPETDIGFVDFRSFRDLEQFNEFLKETFSRIKEEKITHLIIDIRNNGGGNSMLGDAFLDYLTDKPFTQYREVEIKVSKQIKENYRGWKELQSAADGSMLSYQIEEKKPKKNPLRYEGDVYLLTGAFTFSSAADFAAAFKYYDIGTIIGDETGGLMKCFGDVYTFHLPNTKLTIGVSHKTFVTPSKEEELFRGVTPHHTVIQTPEDTAAGRDSVLEQTLELIRAGN